MPAESILAELARALASSLYDEAVQALSNHRNDLPFDPADRAEATRLAEHCRRLAADRQRLQHVAFDLEQDERSTRDELLVLLGAAPGSWRPPRPSPTLVADPPPPGPPDQTTGLALWVLGSFRLAIDGQVVIGGDDDRSTPVLRSLACSGGTGVHKEQLADRFWPEATSRVARRNLHQSVYTIRRLLGRFGAEAELVFANDHYRLGRCDVWRDTDELARCVEQGRRARSTGQDGAALADFRQADLLYGGELLADHPYDEWAYSMRERYRTLHREAGAALLELHTAAADPLSIIQVSNRLLQLDPSDQDACRHLMRAHVTCGQPHLATMAFTVQAEYLRDNHGLEPAPETMELVRPLMSHSRRR